MTDGQNSFEKGVAEETLIAEPQPVPAIEPETSSEKESAFKTLTRNSAVAMGGGLLAQALKFLVYIYIARQFTSAEFGLVSFGIAVNAFVFVVSHFGLPFFGTREVAVKGYVSRKFLFVIFGIRATIAVAATAVAVTVLAAMPGVGSREYLVVILFGLSNVSLAGLFDWAFQGLHRLDASALLNVIWQALWLVMIWSGVKLGFGIMVVPATFFLSALLTGILSFVWLEWGGLVWGMTESKEDVASESRRILKAGGALAVGTMLVTVLIWTDAIVVRLLRGEQAVGLYAAGNRAALAIAALAGFYVQGVFPFFSKAAHTSRAQFDRYFQHAYDDLCLLFAPAAVWGIFTSGSIMQFFFKRPEYMAGQHVFEVFQIVLLLTLLNNLFGMGVLVVFHRDRTYQNVLVATGLVFLWVCPVLTWRWGIVGAAVSVLAAQTYSLGCFIYKAREFVFPRHIKALLAPSLAGLAAGAICMALELSLLPATLVLLFAYAILVLARVRMHYGSIFSAETAN